MAIEECDASPPVSIERERDKQRSRRHRDIGSKTISIKRMTKRALAVGRALYPEDEHADIVRPKTRAECRDGFRPCPFVSCSQHLYLDVIARTGALKLNFPDIEADELEKMPATCTLDVAELEGVTLEEVGRHMNMTRERVRQIEVPALAKVKAAHEARSLRDIVGDTGPVKRHLPIVEQRHERMEWTTHEDFDVDHFVSDKLDL